MAETPLAGPRRTDPYATDHVYWLARETSESRPPFVGRASCDVAVVGAGFTGLWTAIRLLETDPSLRVTVLEQGVVGFGASGRNGGFCEASLTHGLVSGLHHFPDEIEVLQEEGRRNLRELVTFVRDHGIECALEETGHISVATRPSQLAEFAEDAETAARYGEDPVLLDRDEIRALVHSPIYEAAIRYPPTHTVMVDPAALCRGLARFVDATGATIHERTRVERVERTGGGLRLVTRTDAGGPGALVADRVVVATSGYSGWLRPLRRVVVPVYDYVLVSAPLTPDQREAIGWQGREGMSDADNRFHYFRLTADDRILWGGFDAIYHYGSRIGPELDHRPATFATLERNFAAMFPQLAGLPWEHRWGGVIDTSARFHVTFGTSHDGRLHHAIGYTGLGVGASRWAGGILRDMILRPDSELLRLRLVRQPPFPWPPEPIRTIGIRWVQRELARADAREGRRGLTLRLLDAMGIGFDS